MKKRLLTTLVFTAFCGFAQNLLLNPSYEFHSFQNHRSGAAANYYGNSAAFWHYEAFGDMTVQRESHVNADKRPYEEVRIKQIVVIDK